MTAQRKRGFAAMNRDQQRAIASKGGRAAHRKGTAHEFSPEEARKAGYLGGKAVSANREHMAAIGRKGGQRAGRTVETRKNTQIPEQQGANADVLMTPPHKEYPSQANDVPTAVLPHWRDMPSEIPPTRADEQETEQATEDENTTHNHLPSSQATNGVLPPPPSPIKE